MTIIGHHIYIYGGHSSNQVYNDLYKLNKITYIWEKINIKSGFTPPRLIGVSGARVGKKIYISGGCDNDAKFCNKDTFIFDTENKEPKWEKLSDTQEE